MNILNERDRLDTHSFHTYLSVSLTILIFVISLLLTYCLGHDFIYRNNPLTLESTANRDYLYILNLTK